MVAPAVALLYPTLLASLASNPNLTIFADDSGTQYVIDLSEPDFTEAEELEISESIREITFHLYTRNNPLVGQELIIGNADSVKNSFWNPHNPTYIVTHGWRGHPEDNSCIMPRDAYLSVGDYNVILVDWQKTAKFLLYWKVVKSVPLVATLVANMINYLEKNFGLDPATTRAVGHSLGGHVISLAARFAKTEIAEVIALDPAKPKFEFKGPGERVDASDASLVHAIHTNAGVLGLEEPVGHADFYPNGGKDQPGCSWIAVGCAHSRSYEYYAESIRNPKGFRAGDVFMGGPELDRRAKGSYVLQTNRKPPFALD
nr:PREDICTED: pancreatic triacylglycerol lipase-like [Linepithema humile]